MEKFILLSGPMAVGKSTIASELITAHRFQVIKTGAYLMNLARVNNLDQSRKGLQELGDSLDLETDYRWLINDVALPTTIANYAQERWLVDCVRKHRQVDHFRSVFGTSVYHVFLTAPEAALKERYERRIKAGDEYLDHTPYENAILHPNEVSARQLIEIADLIVDVTQKQPKETVQEILNTNT